MVMNMIKGLFREVWHLPPLENILPPYLKKIKLLIFNCKQIVIIIFGMVHPSTFERLNMLKSRRMIHPKDKFDTVIRNPLKIPILYFTPSSMKSTKRRLVSSFIKSSRCNSHAVNLVRTYICM